MIRRDGTSDRLEVSKSPLDAPGLEHGQHLTLEEFLSRWDSSRATTSAELLDGVVHMTPVGWDHSASDSAIQSWLGYYLFAIPGLEMISNATIILDGHAVQPDSGLVVRREAGGRMRLENGLLASAPELVVEVAVTTAEIDLGFKRDLYRRFGVEEYLVVLPTPQQILWWSLHLEGDAEIGPDRKGWWRSRRFPGLWLDGESLLAGRRVNVKAALDAGLATDEHRAFVERLTVARPSTSDHHTS